MTWDIIHHQYKKYSASDDLGHYSSSVQEIQCKWWPGTLFIISTRSTVQVGWKWPGTLFIIIFTMVIIIIGVVIITNASQPFLCNSVIIYSNLQSVNTTIELLKWVSERLNLLYWHLLSVQGFFFFTSIQKPKRLAQKLRRSSWSISTRSQRKTGAARNKLVKTYLICSNSCS